MTPQSDMRPQFTTPQINKHIVGTQQPPMQLFQKVVQIRGGMSQAQIKAPCNSNLAIIEDLPSMEIRQKIIFKIEEEIKKSGNPKMAWKSPGELESLAYSQSKTRIEYFRYLARIFACISYSKSPTEQQQCQAANITSQPDLRHASPPINKQQVMSNIGAQNASNQYPTQQIQQAVKISSSSSQAHAMTICTSNSTTDKSLPSMAVCQRIIPQIEEQLRRYGNPNISIKSPEEIESQGHSEVKTKFEYPVFTEVESRQPEQQVSNMTPTPFSTHPINRQQVMMSTVGVQGTTQQLQMQRFQQNAQVPSSLSRESHMIAPCNSYLATNRDWPSVSYRRRIISKIEEQLNRWGNPNASMKSPEEIEYQVYSNAKTKADYLAKLAHLVHIEVKASRQQPQGAWHEMSTLTPVSFG